MALRLKTQRDGKTLRPYWYGKYIESGKVRIVTLTTMWKGTPPASGRVGDAGDAEFEASRERAEAELARFVDESKQKGRAESLTERLIKSKTGKAVEYVRLDDLPKRWRAIGRKATPTEAHLAICDTHFAGFIRYMKKNAPDKVHLYEVTDDDVKGYVDGLRATYAPASAQYKIRLLKNTFDRFMPIGAKNHFAEYVGQRGGVSDEVIHRKPFTPEELRAVLEAARNDPFMLPLVVCAAMTGMRRGDVCRLDWSAVDLKGGALTVKTGKTGAEVFIPIFPLLRDVLEAAGPKRKGYVWPDAAAMLAESPRTLSGRFKSIAAVALGGYTPEDVPEAVPLTGIMDEVEDAIRANIPEGKRRARMMDVMRRYSEGQGVRQIEREIGVSRATISTDLNAVESWTGKPFNRRGAGRHSKQSIGAAIQRLTQQQRGAGLKAASIHDWHALRTTWITLALSAGVPMELVRRVTGHATVDVVLKHYFRPDREQFKAALNGLLPDVLTGGGKAKRLSAGDELAALVAKVQTKTATEDDKKRLRLLAAKV